MENSSAEGGARGGSSESPEEPNDWEAAAAEEPEEKPQRGEESTRPAYKSRSSSSSRDPKATDPYEMPEEDSAVFVSTSEGGDWASLEKEQIKLELLEKVASLDRGFAVTPRRAANVREVIEKLETLCGSVSLTGYEGPGSEVSEDMDMMGGVWRLLYSTGFDRGNLGGRRPGPLIGQVAITPFTVGQIFQRIDVTAGELDNVVDFNYNGLRLPWLSPLDTPTVRLTLKHTFKVQGTSSLKVAFVSTSVEVLNSGFELPKVDLPPVPEFLREAARGTDAEFNVIFVDETLRVTEGDRGELRIFVRDAMSTLI